RRGRRAEHGRAVSDGPAELRLVALRGLPAVRPGADLAALIAAAARAQGLALANGVLVVAQKVVSKAEGRLVRLADVEPSAVVRHAHGVWLAETRHGFGCANAGVDLSTAPEPDVAVLLPADPDASARRLRDALVAAGAGPLAVIVSDTFGRPWREGLVDVALG